MGFNIPVKSAKQTKDASISPLPVEFYKLNSKDLNLLYSSGYEFLACSISKTKAIFRDAKAAI